jgi:hypothetical protein
VERSSSRFPDRQSGGIGTLALAAAAEVLDVRSPRFGKRGCLLVGLRPEKDKQNSSMITIRRMRISGEEEVDMKQA